MRRARGRGAPPRRRRDGAGAGQRTRARREREPEARPRSTQARGNGRAEWRPTERPSRGPPATMEATDRGARPVAKVRPRASRSRHADVLPSCVFKWVCSLHASNIRASSIRVKRSGEDTAVARRILRGKAYPVAWINQYGKARVFGTTYGHSDDTFRDPVYLEYLSRGLLWAAGRLEK